MRRYQFRLERLLTIRKHHELEWELKLAAITGECVRLQDELEEMDRERRSTLAYRYREGGLDMAYLTAAELYMRRIDARTVADRKELVEKEDEREGVRETYLKVSKERKVLDRLKERREINYRRDHLVKETLEVDDMSGSTAAWRTGQG